jgi:NAD(P)-dependent dehydrogenase (short-subunit alcohol dehydrogenase family)
MSSGAHDWLGLAGKLVAVTGAGGGIGRAIAVAFSDAGAQVVLLERDAKIATETADAVLAKSGRAALVAPCDVSDIDSVDMAGRQVLADAGPVDVLVNNAALMRPGALDSITPAEWSAVMAVNLTGYLNCSQVFGRQMRPRGTGSIVHIASISGRHPQGNSGAYSVSKAGIIMLSRQLATEWGPSGVRSNVVSPGMIETPLTRAFYETPGVRERRNAVVPTGRIGQPEDIANAVLFLASMRAAYINGDEITVDGGYTRQLMNMIPRPGYQ